MTRRAPRGVARAGGGRMNSGRSRAAGGQEEKESEGHRRCPLHQLMDGPPRSPGRLGAWGRVSGPLRVPAGPMAGPRCGAGAGRGVLTRGQGGLPPRGRTGPRAPEGVPPLSTAGWGPSREGLRVSASRCDLPPIPHPLLSEMRRRGSPVLWGEPRAPLRRPPPRAPGQRGRQWGLGRSALPAPAQRVGWFRGARTPPPPTQVAASA